jgi:hypothetical protein
MTIMFLAVKPTMTNVQHNALHKPTLPPTFKCKQQSRVRRTSYTPRAASTTNRHCYRMTTLSVTTRRGSVEHSGTLLLQFSCMRVEHAYCKLQIRITMSEASHIQCQPDRTEVGAPPESDSYIRYMQSGRAGAVSNKGHWGLER